MRELFTEIEIHASSEKVWQILTDFSAYPEWNPFVLRVKGAMQVGKRIETTLRTSAQKVFKTRPRVLKLVPRREFRWQGTLGFPGLFDREHIFEIHSPAPRVVRFIHRQVYSGLFSSVVFNNMGEDFRHGFEEMNRALKERCEKA